MLAKRSYRYCVLILMMASLPFLLLAKGGGSRVGFNESGTEDSVRVQLDTARGQLPPKEQISASTIKKLITALGDTSFTVRENATRQLTDIGMPALELLHDAEGNAGDVETRLRAAMLTKKLRVANRLPPRVNGVEFRLIIEKEWALPIQSSISTFSVALELKNTTETPCRFIIQNAIKVILMDCNGKNIVDYGGRARAGGLPYVSQPVDKDATFVMQLRGAFLSFNHVEARFTDPCYDYWESTPISIGAYQLRLVYENDRCQSDEGYLLWRGQAETLTETVNIK